MSKRIRDRKIPVQIIKNKDQVTGVFLMFSLPVIEEMKMEEIVILNQPDGIILIKRPTMESRLTHKIVKSSMRCSFMPTNMDVVGDYDCIKMNEDVFHLIKRK